MIVDGNHPDSQEREDVFQIIANFQIITSETGKVFDNHNLNISVPDQVNHPLEVRSLEVRTRKTIVAEFHLGQSGKIRIQSNMPLDQLTLGGNTVAFILCLICPLVHIFQ